MDFMRNIILSLTFLAALQLNAAQELKNNTEILSYEPNFRDFSKPIQRNSSIQPFRLSNLFKASLVFLASAQTNNALVFSKAPKFSSSIVPLASSGKAMNLIAPEILPYAKKCHALSGETYDISDISTTDFFTVSSIQSSADRHLLYIGKQLALIVEKDDNDLYFAFRGSFSVRDWVVNAGYAISPVKSKTGNIDHRSYTYTGFDLRYLLLDQKIKSVTSDLLQNEDMTNYNIYITGHSLGGALAQIHAHNLLENLKFQSISLITFSSPAAFSGHLADYTERSLRGSLRFYEANDIVPKLPPQHLGEFKHIGTPIRLNDSFSNGAISKETEPHDKFLRALKFSSLIFSKTLQKNPLNFGNAFKDGFSRFNDAMKDINSILWHALLFSDLNLKKDFQAELFYHSLDRYNQFFNQTENAK